MPAQFSPDHLFVDGALHAARSLAVSSAGDVVAASGGARVDLPGRALLPGLVNAHSHAFQRLLRGQAEFVAAGRARDDFWTWRERMYQAAERLDPDALYAVSRQAFLEMARGGVTAVGEFHYLHHAPDGRPYADSHKLAVQVVRAAREVGLRIVLLRVAYARSGWQLPVNPRQARFLSADVDGYLDQTASLRARFAADPLVSVGLAPHSVRAVPREWLEAIARQPAQLVHLHVAEQPAEISACQAEHGRRPVELLGDVGLLHPKLTAVHAIHLAPNEVEALGRAGANVCACPSTERNLGDGVVPADALLAAGATLALGSDSQATIDLLDEARQLDGHLRLLRQRRAVLDPGQGDPNGLAARLLFCATGAGARSLCLSTGGLTAGQPADFFTLDLEHPSVLGAPADRLLAALVFGAEKSAVRDVAVQGRLIIRDGHHPLEDEIRRDYLKVSRRLLA